LIMATDSAAEIADWQVTENGRRAMSLVVHLRQRSYVFPWGLFLFAEGDDAVVRAVFHTHVVRVEGNGLTSLLQDLAEQSVCELVEPDRAAKFRKDEGSQVTAVSVSENK
jgi:hypothetical protein